MTATTLHSADSDTIEGGLTTLWRRLRARISAPRLGVAATIALVLLALTIADRRDLLSLRAIWLTGGAAFLVWMSILDLRDRRVPNRCVYPALIAALVGSSLIGVGAAIDATTGLLVGFALMLGLALLSRGSMGMGDVKLAAFCGALLGPGAVLYALAFASIGAALVAALLILTRRASMQHTMPLVPFLALASITLIVATQ